MSNVTPILEEITSRTRLMLVPAMFVDVRLASTSQVTLIDLFLNVFAISRTLTCEKPLYPSVHKVFLKYTNQAHPHMTKIEPLNAATIVPRMRSELK